MTDRRVLFRETRQLRGNRRYIAGDSYSMSAREARKWVGAGVAEYVDEDQAERIRPAVAPAAVSADRKRRRKQDVPDAPLNNADVEETMRDATSLSSGSDDA